ncbi:MAG: flavodoxin family protein [Verrucomicrobiota bacterium]
MSTPTKVYFATMTGNAESLASGLVDKAKERNLDAVLVDMAEVSPSDLLQDKHAVFIVSTWGEGEPPDDADPFWNELESAELDLSGLRYSVFGLGDRGYEYFNGFARILDERLAALGAVSVFERVEADIDYDADFEDWEARVLGLLESPSGQLAQEAM